jgi:para-nitrobenzyl esterase
MAFRPFCVAIGAVVAVVTCSAGCDDDVVADPIGGADVVVADDADDVPVGLVDDDGVVADPVCPTLPPADDPLEVRTTFATLRGGLSDEGGFSWKAIRYGAPPVGERRFQKPAPPSCEATVQDATRDPPQCLQLGVDFDAIAGDEDCLFLNVFRPERIASDPEQLPVLFWIHGGGQLLGSGHQPTGFGNLYDGAVLAKESRTIVVSINYRLGPLGFLAHPALQNADGATGNWAHHDILAALRWTQNNIGAFGGDPDRVTIFGESAGAHNVCVMLASPLARGLFSGAIAQSGGCDTAPLDVRSDEGRDTAAAVGCTGDGPDAAECLRAVSGESLMRTLPPIPPLLHVWRLPWGSTVDGEVLTDQPLKVIARGEHNAVPTIVGSNRDEAALFLGAVVPLTCFDLRLQFELMLSSSFDDDDARDALIDDVMDAYDCGDRFVMRDVLLEVATDLEFTCQARRLTRALRENQVEPTFRYQFRDSANYGVYAAMGAFHAWELAYVFDSFAELLYIPSSAERELGALMQRAWGNLAHSGTPDVDGSIGWLESNDDATFAFDEDPFAAFGGALDVGMIADPSPQCDVWDAVADL